MNHISEVRLGEDRCLFFMIDGRKFRVRRDDIHAVIHGDQAAAQIWEVPVVPTTQTRLAVTA